MKGLSSILFMLTACCLPLTAAFAGTSADRVEALMMLGDYATAATEAGRALNSHSGRREELYYLKGLCELKLKRCADARESFGCLINSYPNSKKAFDARVGIGDSYMIEGNLNEAVGTYQGILRDHAGDRNIPVVYSRLAGCYKALGVTEKAEYYRKMSGGAAPISFDARGQTVPARPVSATAENAMPAASSAQPRQQAVIMPSKSRAAVTNVSTRSSGITPAAVSAEPENIDLVMATDRTISVQVGSFRNRRNAEKLARKLASAGYESRVEIPVAQRDGMYRVKVGRYPSKGEAQAAATRLKASGYTTEICDGDTCE